MCFYYVLHEYVLPESETFTGGKRNCATFLYGSFMYAVIYAVLKNLQLRYGMCMDAVIAAFFTIVLSDAVAMSVIYRQYYGRSILNEIELDENVNKWIFDEKTQKYRPKPESQILKEKLDALTESQRVISTYKAKIARYEKLLQADTEKSRILEHKQKIRAARTIQRWWREKLYRPPTGIFYKRALQDFTSRAA